MKQATILLNIVMILFFHSFCLAKDQKNYTSNESDNVEIFNFRKIRWGMSIDEVVAREDSELLSRQDDRNYPVLFYSVPLFDRVFTLLYIFNIVDGQAKLASASYIVSGSANGIPLSEYSCSMYFELFVSEIIKKYGKPIFIRGKGRDYIGYDDQELSYFERRAFAVWDLDETIIDISISKQLGSDGLSLSVGYRSKDFFSELNSERKKNNDYEY